MLPAHRSEYIPALDVLRALAVLLVMLRHFSSVGMAEGTIGFGPLDNFMLNGWIGVDLFFLLSGYLIARPFFTGSFPGWKPYLWRRALRILPAYFLVLALLVMGAFPFYDFAREDLGWRVTYHLLFLQDYLPADILVVLWSLGVEEKFYLLCPLLLPLILRAPLRWQYVALLGVILLGPLARALALAVYGPATDYPMFFEVYRSPFHACIDGLFLGVLVARLHVAGQLVHLKPRQAQQLFFLGLGGLLILLASVELLAYLGPVAAVLRPNVISLLMALLLLATVAGGMPRWLEQAPLLYTGRISYSLYLLHLPLLGLALAMSSHVSSSWLVQLAFFALFSFAAAGLSYRLVEQPFLRLKNKL